MTFSKSIPNSISETPSAALRQPSWFCHIEAAGVRFVVSDLMISSDNGLGAAATAVQIGIGG
jgi:hypothetical protein